jgi:hypothetical protein
MTEATAPIPSLSDFGFFPQGIQRTTALPSPNFSGRKEPRKDILTFQFSYYPER